MKSFIIGFAAMFITVAAFPQKSTNTADTVYSGDVDPCIPDQADPLCEGMLLEV